MKRYGGLLAVRVLSVARTTPKRGGTSMVTHLPPRACKPSAEHEISTSAMQSLNRKPWSRDGVQSLRVSMLTPRGQLLDSFDSCDMFDRGTCRREGSTRPVTKSLRPVFSSALLRRGSCYIKRLGPRQPPCVSLVSTTPSPYQQNEDSESRIEHSVPSR